MEEPTFEILIESDTFNLVRVHEPDGETVYNLEFGNVTIHFFREEWEEFQRSVSALERHAPAR